MLLVALMQSDVDRDGLRRGATVEHLFDGGGGEMARERTPGDEHRAASRRPVRSRVRVVDIWGAVRFV